MIKIKLNDWPDPSSVIDTAMKKIAELWKKWRNDCDDITRSICNDVDNGADPADIEIQASLYSRKSIKPIHFMNKEGPFRGKCVYCEAFITDLQRGDVEHFRPKGKVTDDSDQPIRIRDRNNIERDHWGYYWLAYAKLNLMPACQLCNQPSSGNLGKRMRFPLEDERTRACYHNDNVALERPMLINPLDPDDNPEKHLRVDPDTGVMIAKTHRGDACIKIYGLNRRDQLVTSRQNAARTIKLLWQRPNENNAELRRILIDAADAHTLASRCAYRELVNSLPHIDV